MSRQQQKSSRAARPPGPQRPAARPAPPPQPRPGSRKSFVLTPGVTDEEAAAQTGRLESHDVKSERGSAGSRDPTRGHEGHRQQMRDRARLTHTLSAPGSAQTHPRPDSARLGTPSGRLGPGRRGHPGSPITPPLSPAARTPPAGLPPSALLARDGLFFPGPAGGLSAHSGLCWSQCYCRMKTPNSQRGPGRPHLGLQRLTGPSTRHVP